jgi:hypothetical protein
MMARESKWVIFKISRKRLRKYLSANNNNKKHISGGGDGKREEKGIVPKKEATERVGSIPSSV